MKTPRILLVEDERLIANDLREALEDFGYAVVDIAATGVEAIEMARRYDPDLIVMDIRLRDEMDGIEAAEQIHAEIDVAVVFLSDNADEHTLERAKRTGPFGYLIKPFREKELRSTIEMVLYKHEMVARMQELQVDLRHKVHELESRELEIRKLSSAVECSPAAVIIADAEGRIEYVNPAFYAMTGYAAGAVQGRALEELMADDPAASLIADMRRTLGAGDNWHSHIRMRKQDGETLWISQSIAPIRSADGHIDHWVCVGEDISEEIRKKRQTSVCHQMREQVWQMQQPGDITAVVTVLQESLRELEIGYHGCGISLVEEDLDTTKVIFNRSSAARDMSDEDSAEAQRLIAAVWHSGRPLYRRDLVQEDRFAERERIESLFGLVRSVIDVPFSHGTISVNSLVANGFSSEDIESLKLLAEVLSEGYRRSQDLEALERTEKQLLQAQKMEAIGQLAGGVAHDFNNMVSVVTGYCSLMLQDIDESHPHYPFIMEIDKSGKKTTMLVRQLLAFSRRQVAEPVVLDLNAVVADLGKMLWRLIGEDKELVVESGRDLGRVMADPSHIEQVIMNLVINARDAIKGNGRIEIETSNIRVEPLAEQDYPGVDPGDYVMLRISDTGCGMDRQTQERIFEPFFTTKGPDLGTGLGLATVYGIIKQSEGHILVESEPGAGTSFRVLLPRIYRSREKVEAQDQVDLGTLRGTETVLVAEDDMIVLDLVKNILRQSGYNAIGVERGDQALRCCEEEGGEVDLLLADIVMPGISGPELAKQLKVRFPALKVIYMTGHNTQVFVRHGLVGKEVPLINKPFTLEELLGEIRRVLDAQ